MELTGLARTYPGATPVEALRPTTLTIAAGDHVAITGRSGSGKSTLLQLLGLLDRPTAGAYRLAGRDVADLPDRERAEARAASIGFVFQAFHLLAHRTVTDNVALGLTYGATPRTERAERVAHALERVGLSHRATFRPGQLSGGERQRVAIARAVVSAPTLLLADEPTGNLDSATAADVLDVFDALHTEGQTLVVVTHDAEVAARAGRQLHLTDGRLVERTGGLVDRPGGGASEAGRIDAAPTTPASTSSATDSVRVPGRAVLFPGAD